MKTYRCTAAERTPPTLSIIKGGGREDTDGKKDQKKKATTPDGYEIPAGYTGRKHHGSNQSKGALPNDEDEDE